jgi:hypothetical protein
MGTAGAGGQDRGTPLACHRKEVRWVMACTLEVRSCRPEAESRSWGAGMGHPDSPEP